MTPEQLNELAAMKAALKQHIDEAERFKDAQAWIESISSEADDFIARARTMSPLACRIALEGVMALDFIVRTDYPCKTYDIAAKRLLNILSTWKGGQP